MRKIRLVSLFVTVVTVGALNVYAQQTGEDPQEKFKKEQAKLEQCQQEIADLKSDLNEIERKITELEKNPNAHTIGIDHCSDCDEPKNDLFSKWNQNLDSIKAREMSLLTDEEKIIKNLCREKDQCKPVNKFVTYRGKNAALLNMTAKDSGGSCGILFEYAIPMSGGNEMKTSLRLYQIILTKPDQEIVNRCWYVKNKLDYAEFLVKRKKTEDSRSEKQKECDKLEEDISKNDDFQLLNLPGADSRQEIGEPKTEDLNGDKEIENQSHSTNGQDVKKNEPDGPQFR